ncbi:MAG TPA: YciI family protein [Aeromicrobium sp.]|nr:YciI family protein [Aeromicrobium sp.]
MAKYLMSVFGPESDYDKDNWGYESEEQMQQSFADTEAFNKKLQEQGYFVFADGLERPSAATVVDGMGEKPIFTDGPFAETKEYIAGFWIVDVPSDEVARQLAAEASKACLGKVELRPIMAGPE